MITRFYRFVPDIGSDICAFPSVILGLLHQTLYVLYMLLIPPLKICGCRKTSYEGTYGLSGSPIEDERG